MLAQLWWLHAQSLGWVEVVPREEAWRSLVVIVDPRLRGSGRSPRSLNYSPTTHRVVPTSSSQQVRCHFVAPVARRLVGPWVVVVLVVVMVVMMVVSVLVLLHWEQKSRALRPKTL